MNMFVRIIITYLIREFIFNKPTLAPFPQKSYLTSGTWVVACRCVLFALVVGAPWMALYVSRVITKKKGATGLQKKDPDDTVPEKSDVIL